MFLLFSYSNANIDLKFETDDVDGGKTQGDPESGLSGIPPTFTEKPKIVPNEKGTLVTLKFKIKADPKPEIQWFKVKICFYIFTKNFEFYHSSNGLHIVRTFN